MSVTLIIAPPDGSDRQYDHLTYVLRETADLSLDTLQVQEGLRENRSEQERIERADPPPIGQIGLETRLIGERRPTGGHVVMETSLLRRQCVGSEEGESAAEALEIVCHRSALLLKANRVRRHVEGVQCERHRGEPPHEDGDIDDARFSD